MESPGATGTAAQTPLPALPADVGWQGPSAMAWGQCPNTGAALRGIILGIEKYGCVRAKHQCQAGSGGHRVPQNDLALLQGGSWSHKQDRQSVHRVWGPPRAKRGHRTQGKRALTKLRHTEHRFVRLTQKYCSKGVWAEPSLSRGQGRPRGHVQVPVRGPQHHGFISIMKTPCCGHHNWD